MVLQVLVSKLIHGMFLALAISRCENNPQEESNGCEHRKVQLSYMFVLLGFTSQGFNRLSIGCMVASYSSPL